MSYFDNLTQENIENIYKAVSTNNFAQLGGPANQTGGSALITESLENTLRTLTFTEAQLKLWKDITKIKAYSTVEEHNVINSNGEDISGFQAEGVAGVDTTGDYSREFAKIKCLTTTRSVTHLINNLVNTTENPEALETKTGMIHLLGQAERGLFYGDSTLSAGGVEGMEWDGILKQAYDGNTIDLRGKDLEDKHLNKATETVLNNYGMATKVYMPTDVASLFSENYYPNQRAIMNTTGGAITAGTVISQFNTVGGTIDISPDVFMRRGLEELNPNSPSYGQEAPTAPSVTGEFDTTTDKGKFTLGTYKYAVVAYNNQGKSVPVEIATPIAVTDTEITQGIKLSITNSAVQVFAPDYFVIYRTEVNGDKFYEIARIGAKSKDKAAVTEFVDLNDTLPNTAQVILGDFTENSLAFKQLAPMFKLDYALTAPIKRFGIFLYGSPVVYAPKRFVVIKNINVKRG